MMSLPVHKYRMSFHLFKYSLVLPLPSQFLTRDTASTPAEEVWSLGFYHMCTCFIWLASKHFIKLWNCFLNLTLVSACSLLSYKNTAEFCMSILYSGPLMNSLISSRSFLLKYSWNFHIGHNVIYKDSLISSFQSVCLLFPFLFLLHWLELPLLNKTGKSGHPYLVPILRESIWSFII